MKKTISILLGLMVLNFCAKAQSAGDTIMVNTFNYSQTYGSGIRDTMIQFPNLSGLTFEKIYMLYNMRCKNGQVSNSTNRNAGCGEWDYSCNTYLTDSSKTDSAYVYAPNYIIKGYTGNQFPYTNQPTFSYYKSIQKQVTHDSIISEYDTVIGNGNHIISAPFQSSKSIAKSQFLWKASELSLAGILAGDMSSIKLNLTSVGSAINFFRIKIKATSDSFLNAASPHVSGFTEVYFSNPILTSGLNEFNFYKNFNWNGIDNIIVEFSFDNTNNGINSLLNADSMNFVAGIISDNKDYSLEFSGGNFVALNNSNFNHFTDQISISFWSYGNAKMLPANTSIIYASDSLNNREANIHLPWSNSTIYWDCGSAGTYDRINKAANGSDFKGGWNHWVFTKNTTTGNMNIYLNGVLWLNGATKTIPIKISDFQIGSQPGLVNPYLGKVDDMTIWNTELSATTIKKWMYKTIDSNHPNYSNLIANYNFNEGAGTTAADSSTAMLSAILNGNPLWRKTQAKDIFKGFNETHFRPTITFVQGTYLQTIISDTIIDSILNNSTTIVQYKVSNKSFVPFDTSIVYAAGYTYTYDAETGIAIDSISINAFDTIKISNLKYYKLYPSRFQIMSFVTPYGIGLDLGANGKTWTFDVSDLAPILKGWKRMTIDAGGQWQEDLNIKFMFIVGTPPHTVKDISNIWKVDNTNYSNILSDNYFEPRVVSLNANASSYKIRTAITGHGQEGEFIPQNHFLNINGGTKEFNWSVWKPCASNPIFPQGGTWIYDRAGWCPGAPTDLQESDITPYVTPGNTAILDYGIQTASGDSRYWVSTELVSYGAANFNLDAAILDIKAPSQKIEYKRINTICDDPTIIIQNTGATTLTSLVIEYWINNNTAKDSYTWHGNLNFLEKTEIVLPVSGNLWSGINSPTNNTFNVQIKSPNAGNDEYQFNNSIHSNFDIPPVLPSELTFYFRTNSAAAESSWQLLNAAGTIISSRNSMANSTTYTDDVLLSPGCYSFVINDTDEDGFDFWANSDGTAQCRIKDVNGSSLKIFNGDFGKSLIYNFTVDYPLSYQQYNKLTDESISIYPIPTQSEFTIQWKHQIIKEIKIANSLGQIVQMPVSLNAETANVDAKGFVKGIYFITIVNEKGERKVEKLLLQ